MRAVNAASHPGFDKEVTVGFLIVASASVTPLARAGHHARTGAHHTFISHASPHTMAWPLTTCEGFDLFLLFRGQDVVGIYTVRNRLILDLIPYGPDILLHGQNLFFVRVGLQP